MVTSFIPCRCVSTVMYDTDDEETQTSQRPWLPSKRVEGAVFWQLVSGPRTAQRWRWVGPR